VNQLIARPLVRPVRDFERIEFDLPDEAQWVAVLKYAKAEQRLYWATHEQAHGSAWRAVAVDRIATAGHGE
jgi:hypothetical protein